MLGALHAPPLQPAACGDKGLFAQVLIRHQCPSTLVHGAAPYVCKATIIRKPARISPIRWQRGYFEHAVRNEKALDRIRTYIANNPARWADAPDNISRADSAEAGRV